MGDNVYIQLIYFFMTDFATTCIFGNFVVPQDIIKSEFPYFRNVNEFYVFMENKCYIYQIVNHKEMCGDFLYLDKIVQICFMQIFSSSAIFSGIVDIKYTSSFFGDNWYRQVRLQALSMNVVKMKSHFSDIEQKYITRYLEYKAKSE
jgi:hypothetical protein